MNKLKKQVTIVFLLVFTLIKVSPVYYRYQFPPVFAKENSKQNVKPVNHDENLLIKVDKSIIDKTHLLAIPPIKFSGLCFDIFFLATALITITKYRDNFSLKYTLINADLYLVQRVFRL